MMPEKVWNMPPLGTMNLHGSLLPQYRGAAPINWAIINGEKITGVTTFILKHEIDTGNILMRKEVDIMPEDDFGTMYEKLKSIGADLVVDSLNKIITGNYTEIPQEEFGFTQLINAPKIYKELGKINPNNDVESVHDLIRGLSPIPAAYIEFDDKFNKPTQLKIFKSTFETTTNSVSLGFVTDNKTFLKYGCNDGLLNILELQLQGKKRMKVDEFLRGYKF
jgi:methionyl-tRNA formyltransferase